MVNIVLIFDLQTSNKFVNNTYKSEGLGIQRFEDDFLGISAKLVVVFAQSLGVFT